MLHYPIEDNLSRTIHTLKKFHVVECFKEQIGKQIANAIKKSYYMKLPFKKTSSNVHTCNACTPTHPPI